MWLLGQHRMTSNRRERAPDQPVEQFLERVFAFFKNAGYATYELASLALIRDFPIGAYDGGIAGITTPYRPVRRRSKNWMAVCRPRAESGTESGSCHGAAEARQ